jgi:hypothetical protein
VTISYDYTEAGEGGDFVTLEEGRYVLKLIKAATGESKAGNPKAIIDFEVLEGKSGIGGTVRQDWPTTGAASFRWRDFLKALGVELPKSKKGKLDIRKYYGTEIGALATIEEGDERDFTNLKNLMPGDQMRALLGVDDEEEDEEEYDEEDEEEEEEEEEEEDEEDEDEDEDEDEEDDEEVVTKADLKSMDLDELKELADEWEVSTRKPKGKNLTKRVMLTRLNKFIDELEEEADADEDEDEEPF